MKPNRPACAASQPYAARGPRSSSVPRRCSDVPGLATHLGSGCAANSCACSASVRKALAIVSDRPAARAAAASRSNASAVSGRIGLPCRSANGPGYSPSPIAAPSAATAATARARPPMRAPPGSSIAALTVTVARSGSGPVRDVDVDPRAAVAQRRAAPDVARERDVRGGRQVPRRAPGLERPGTQVDERPRRRERAEVGGALARSVRRHARCDQRQGRPARDDDEETADQQQRRLTALPAAAHARVAPGARQRVLPGPRASEPDAREHGAESLRGGDARGGEAARVEPRDGERGERVGRVTGDEHERRVVEQRLDPGGARPADGEHDRAADGGGATRRRGRGVGAGVDGAPHDPPARPRLQVARGDAFAQPARRSRRGARAPRVPLARADDERRARRRTRGQRTRRARPRRP